MDCTQGNVMLKNQSSLIVGNFIFVQYLHASAIPRSFFILCCVVTKLLPSVTYSYETKAFKYVWQDNFFSKVIKIRDLFKGRIYSDYTQKLLCICTMIFLFSTLSHSLPFPPVPSFFCGREGGIWRGGQKCSFNKMQYNVTNQHIATNSVCLSQCAMQFHSWGYKTLKMEMLPREKFCILSSEIISETVDIKKNHTTSSFRKRQAKVEGMKSLGNLSSRNT